MWRDPVFSFLGYCYGKQKKKPALGAPASCPLKAGFLLGLGGFDDLGEGGGVRKRQVGQDLAIEADGGLLQAGDQARVGRAEFAGRGVDAHGPQGAVRGLLVAAMLGREFPGLVDRFLRELEVRLLTSVETLGALEDLLAARAGGY